MSSFKVKRNLAVLEDSMSSNEFMDTFFKKLS